MVCSISNLDLAIIFYFREKIMGYNYIAHGILSKQPQKIDF